MFSIELFRWNSIEFGHLELIDDETFLLNCIDDLTHVLVWAWLNHSKCSLTIIWLLVFSGNVTVGSNLYDTAHYGYPCAKIEIAEANLWIFYSFEEWSIHFLVMHFNRVVERVEEESVETNNVSLLIIPFYLKDISFFLNRFCNSSWVHVCFVIFLTKFK